MAPRTLALIMAESWVVHAKMAAPTAEETDRPARENGTADPASSPVYPTPATLRHQLKRTPEEMAGLAGISPATWRSWEQGHASPDPALLPRLWKIADALALSDADDFEAPRLKIGLRPADFT